MELKILQLVFTLKTYLKNREIANFWKILTNYRPNEKNGFAPPDYYKYLNF